jgi:hypothetical protein
MINDLKTAVGFLDLRLSQPALSNRGNMAVMLIVFP